MEIRVLGVKSHLNWIVSMSVLGSEHESHLNWMVSMGVLVSEILLELE